MGSQVLLQSARFQSVPVRTTVINALEPSAPVDEIKQAPGRTIVLNLYHPEIFTDIARIISLHYRTQRGYLNPERRKIREFIQAFVPLLFRIEEISVLSDDLEEGEDETRSIFSEESVTIVKQEEVESSASPTLSTNDDSKDERKTPDATGTDQQYFTELCQMAKEAILSSRSEYTLFCNGSL